MKYAILGEDVSDAATVRALVRRLIERKASIKGKSTAKKAKKPSFKSKGYDGWAHLRRKAARDLQALSRMGWQRFIVCVDCDGRDSEPRRIELQREVIAKSGLAAADCCLVIPVQELEAWLLADIEEAGPKVILSWTPAAVASPERQASPKEHLRRLSQNPLTKKPRYDEVLHNEKLAEHLRLDRVEKKCPSFMPLVNFVAVNG